MDQATQPPTLSNEMKAFQQLAQAAERYLGTLDDLARPIVMEKLQASANLIVSFIAFHNEADMVALSAQSKQAEPTEVKEEPTEVKEESEG